MDTTICPHAKIERVLNPLVDSQPSGVDTKPLNVDTRPSAPPLSPLLRSIPGSPAAQSGPATPHTTLAASSKPRLGFRFGSLVVRGFSSGFWVSGFGLRVRVQERL
jgi:hypothetical protein